MEIFEEVPKQRKYIKSRINNQSFTPTFSDSDFVQRFDAYCRRTGKNKTRVAQEWLSERLQQEEEDEINNMSIDELRKEVRALRGTK